MVVVRKEHKLVKGGGYHLDLLVVALSILLNSLLGIPWYVASTILSITHVRSLNRESGISCFIKKLFMNPLC
jgi:sodium bicarbonate cotransporter 7